MTITIKIDKITVLWSVFLLSIAAFAFIVIEGTSSSSLEKQEAELNADDIITVIDQLRAEPKTLKAMQLACEKIVIKRYELAIYLLPVPNI